MRIGRWCKSILRNNTVVKVYAIKKYKLIKEALKEITGEPGKLFEFCDKHKDDEDLMDIYEDINAYLETDMGKWVGKIQGKIEIKDTVDISCNGLNEGGDI